MHNSKTEYLKGLLEVPGKSDEVVDHAKPTENPNYRVGKTFWTYIKSMRINGSGNNTLVVDNKEIHDAKGKAQALSNQYSSVFTDEDVTNIPSMSVISYPQINEIDKCRRYRKVASKHQCKQKLAGQIIGRYRSLLSHVNY